ncbi:GntR family transcriptional regulator [Mangrovicoccus sp. HB161399]|uniref:GntR family transcriptional regulator n=1 Tax=Mangrovicoccus sp. HB161399 TaxID=2720392 RepID=UPI0015549685|nr:GntR family transcriptional regulator [Mangrovicoccus sp. HB161399]
MIDMTGRIRATEKGGSDAAAGGGHRPEQIYAALRQRICTNRITPGETLREEVLAKEFDVSRSPIRRALAKLEHEGLVEVRHGVGTRVTEIDKAALAGIYEIRMMLWVQTGPYFQKDLPADLADRLEGHLAAFRALEPMDLHGFADVNVRYYLDFTSCVANECLREMHRSLFFSTSRMWLIQLPMVDWAEMIASIGSEIEDMMRAIRANDPDGLGYIARNAIATNVVPYLGIG